MEQIGPWIGLWAPISSPAFLGQYWTNIQSRYWICTSLLLISYLFGSSHSPSSQVLESLFPKEDSKMFYVYPPFCRLLVQSNIHPSIVQIQTIWISLEQWLWQVMNPKQDSLLINPCRPCLKFVGDFTLATKSIKIGNLHVPLEHFIVCNLLLLVNSNK